MAGWVVCSPSLCCSAKRALLNEHALIRPVWLPVLCACAVAGSVLACLFVFVLATVLMNL